jgi:hypothetical protein
MANGVEILKSGVKIALSKSILQHHILNTKFRKKKPFHKKKEHQIYEDKNWTRGLVVGKSKYLH